MTICGSTITSSRLPVHAGTGSTNGSTTTIRVSAPGIPGYNVRSDNCGNNTDLAPILADIKPTAPAGDPPDGIPVPGGKVHRGTGEYVNPNNPNDKRAAVYLWVDFNASDICKACAWYQFLKIEVSLDRKDATKAAEVGGRVPNSIGGTTTPGKWCSTGGLSQILGRLPLHKKASGDHPPDEEHTIVITSHFRDYRYCIDPVKCLGYSEVTYVETIKIKLTWVRGDVELGTKPSWKAAASVVSDTSTVKFDGKWKDCP